MSERNPALTMSHSVRILELLIDHYGRLAWIERSGRVYEWLGIRFLYQVVARIFGEPVLPGCRSLRSHTPQLPSGLTTTEIRERRDRTLYLEISNLVILLCYAPLAVILWSLHSLLVVYAALLCGLHGTLVLIERYKRALYGVWLDSLPAVPASDTGSVPASKPQPDAPQPSAFAARGFAAWYFPPHRFETDRFYRALGMDIVRNWVTTFTRLTALSPEQRTRAPRSVGGGGIAGLFEFERETRFSEISHFVGLLLQLPFLAQFVLRRMPIGIIYIVMLLFLNLSFMLLQRATRVRLWRVLSKRRVSRQ